MKKVMKTKDIFFSKRKEILKIAKKYGAYNIKLFGSVAKEQDDEKSDIDFIVEMENGRSLFDLGGLLMELQGLLNRKVDVITSAGLKNRLRYKINEEAVPL